MALPVRCIANPSSYEGSGFCSLSCVNGDAIIGPKQAVLMPGYAAHCGGMGPAESMCEVRCENGIPKVVVLPEAAASLQLLFGIGLLLMLCRKNGQRNGRVPR